MDEFRSEEIEKESEAEIVSEEMDSTSSPQAKISFKNKMIILALFGMLLGFVIKTEAAKRITVGFEDYKLPESGKLYDINDLQKGLEIQKKILEEEQKAAESKALEATEGVEGVDSEKTTCNVGAGETCQ